MLTCTLCNKSIGECECPGTDRDAELHAIAYNPDSHIAFKWCRLCDKHYARCRCEKPEFYIIKGGQDITSHGFTNALGDRVIPDLEQR